MLDHCRLMTLKTRDFNKLWMRPAKSREHVLISTGSKYELFSRLNTRPLGSYRESNSIYSKLSTVSPLPASGILRVKSPTTTLIEIIIPVIVLHHSRVHEQGSDDFLARPLNASNSWRLMASRFSLVQIITNTVECLFKDFTTTCTICLASSSATLWWRFHFCPVNDTR
jgi:hypothetical protein